MKKVLALILSLCVMLSMASPVFAAVRALDTGVVDSGDVNINAENGNDVELRGNIVPTILSVTMPSFIPFDLSKTLPTENKVVSPRIEVRNNSAAPVVIYVDNTKIDLRAIPGAFWQTNRYTYNKGIAIGFTEHYASSTLDDGVVKWLQDGKQHTELTRVYPNSANALYVAGSLGNLVPETGTFSVVATLVARQV